MELAEKSEKNYSRVDLRLAKYFKFNHVDSNLVIVVKNALGKALSDYFPIKSSERRVRLNAEILFN